MLGNVSNLADSKANPDCSSTSTKELHESGVLTKVCLT